MTKIAGVTRAKAWFAKGTVFLFPEFWRPPRVQKAPSPELWWMWETFARTLVSVRKVIVNTSLSVRRTLPGFANVHVKARACFGHTPAGNMLARKSAPALRERSWIFAFETRHSLLWFFFWKKTKTIHYHCTRNFWAWISQWILHIIMQPLTSQRSYSGMRAFERSVIQRTGSFIQDSRAFRYVIFFVPLHSCVPSFASVRVARWRLLGIFWGWQFRTILACIPESMSPTINFETPVRWYHHHLCRNEFPR